MKPLWTFLATLGILASLWVVALHWAGLPPVIPVHFNLHGQVDRYGSRAWLWFPVALSVFLFSLLTAIKRLPRLYNLPVPPGDARRLPYEALASSMIDHLRVVLTWLCFLLVFLELDAAHGRLGGLHLWILPLTLVATGLPLVFFLIKSRNLRKDPLR